MTGWLAKSRRVRALTLKEARQIMRDPSSVAIGIVFPMIMILLFGYGLSLDVTRVNVAVVDQDASFDSAGLVGAFRLSPYFDVTAVPSIAQATTLVMDRKVDGALLIPSDFTRRLHSDWSMARTRTRRGSCRLMPSDRSLCGARCRPAVPRPGR